MAHRDRVRVENLSDPKNNGKRDHAIYRSLKTHNEVVHKHDQHDGDDEEVLRPGDHVFVQVGFAQRHGIVLGVPSSQIDADDDEDDERSVEGIETIYDQVPDDCRTIVLTFYEDAVTRKKKNKKSETTKQKNDVFAGLSAFVGENAFRTTATELEYSRTPETMCNDEPRAAAAAALANGGDRLCRRTSLREFTLPQFMRHSTTKPRKVRYGVSRAEQLLDRSGSVTRLRADAPDVVLARARFLSDLDRGDDGDVDDDGGGVRPPEHDALAANDECAAVWCRTGRWTAPRTAAALENAGAVGASAALAATALVCPVAVVPLAIGLGLAATTGGAAAAARRTARERWDETTARLDAAFAESTMSVGDRLSVRDVSHGRSKVEDDDDDRAKRRSKRWDEGMMESLGGYWRRLNEHATISNSSRSGCEPRTQSMYDYEDQYVDDIIEEEEGILLNERSSSIVSAMAEYHQGTVNVPPGKEVFKIFK